LIIAYLRFTGSDAIAPLRTAIQSRRLLRTSSTAATSTAPSPNCQNSGLTAERSTAPMNAP
jgi:hypothetical protein